LKQLDCEGGNCPACLEDGEEFWLKELGYFPDNRIRRELERQPAVCLNPGCSWTDKFKHYPEHEKVCTLRPVQCECGTSVLTGDLDAHKKTCEWWQTTCIHCDTTVTPGGLKEHQGSCPTYPVVCSSCSVKMPRKALDEHLDPMLGDCQQLPCPYGCPGERNSEEHQRVAASAHVRWLAKRQAPRGAASQATTPSAELSALRCKVDTLESLVAVLNRELEIAISTAVDLRIAHDNHLDATQRNLSFKEAIISELKQKVSNLEATTTCGTYVWRISDFAERKAAAIGGRLNSLYSPPFYTHPQGMKLTMRVYLNGDGMGKGTHISLFIAVMRHDYDGLLHWPFKGKVVFTLIDQNNREHVIDAFRADPTSDSFRRPMSEMNIASGSPLFCPLSKLEDRRYAYVKDDEIFIKVTVTPENPEAAEK